MQSSQATHPVWTGADKKKLYELLQMLPLNAYNNIATRVKTKTAEQVKVYIETLKHAASYMYNENADHPKDTVEKAPIEDWVELTQTLVDKEDTDLSAQLGQAMSIISHLEAFPEVGQSDSMQPNYRAIYHFLGQLLKGEELDALGPLESALLLEIFHSLMEVLSGADTSVQRNIMRWKHQLISTRSTASLRKVVDNDFSDFLNDDTILVEDDKPEDDMVDTHNNTSQQARRNSHKEKATAKHQNTPVGAPHEATTTAPTGDMAMDSADDTYIASPISSPMSTQTAKPKSPSSSTTTTLSPTSSTPTHQPPTISTATEQLPSSTETAQSTTSSTSTPQPSCSSATTSGGSTKTPLPKPKPKVEYVIVMPPENATIVTKIVKRTARKSFPRQRAVPSKSHNMARASIEPTQSSQVATTDKVAETLKVKGAISKKLKANLEKAKASGRADQRKDERSTGDRVDKELTQGASNTVREDEVNENSDMSSTAGLVAGTSVTVETNSSQEQQTSVGTSIPSQTNTAREQMITEGTSASAQTHSTQEQLTLQSREKKESWKRKLIPTKSQADFPKKPKLYSLNPLCIPVTLLDLA